MQWAFLVIVSCKVLAFFHTLHLTNTNAVVVISQDLHSRGILSEEQICRVSSSEVSDIHPTSSSQIAFHSVL